MKTAMFGLALASFVSMTVSVALAADLAGSYERNYAGKYERNYITRDDAGCSCDAPGIVLGPVCATPRRCEEMSGLCEGRCSPEP